MENSGDTFTNALRIISDHSRHLHRVRETKNTRPDPTQTRNRVGFKFENQLFFQKNIETCLIQVFVTDINSNVVCSFKNFKR